MAKKQKIQEVYVVNPKIGERYYFKFAGSKRFGPIIALEENLTKSTGHAWFWMLDDAEGAKSSKYPISIYNISKKVTDV